VSLFGAITFWRRIVKGTIEPLGRRRSQAWPRAAFLFLALSLLAALGVPACSSTPASGKTCSLNSDCAATLICAIGVCRQACAQDSDCADGATCVFGVDQAGDKGFYCQAAAVTNKACSTPKDCTAPMACASDYRCRNLCSSNSDCNVLGATNKVCAQDANGVDYCASPSDVTINASGDQVLTAPSNPAATTDAAVVEPGNAPMTVIVAPEGGLPDATTASSGSSGSTSGSSGSMSASGAGTGSASGASGSASGSSSGAASDGGKSCPACPVGYGCDIMTGACAMCGMNQQPCCAGNPCGANLSCNPTTSQCECGNANEPCCGGNGGTCNNNITCVVSDAGLPSSCVCGEIGTACCPAAAAGGVATCLGEGNCAGKTCGCVLEYEPNGAGGNEAIVRLTDGTLRKIYDSNMNVTLNDIYQPVVNSTGPLRVATAPSSIAISGYGAPVGCAVVTDGSVWCFPLRDTLADSTYIGDGGGPTIPVSQAQQVWNSVDGSTKLTGVKQITGGSNYYPSFCAVDGTGAIWCWGYNSGGQLGTGDTNTLPYAAQVKTSVLATFGGAAEVRLGFDAACARKTADSSLWCWGSNAYGQLGVVPSTVFTLNANYYPNQVSITGTLTATKLVVGATYTYCAVMSDTSVICWGYNAYGQVTLPTSQSAPVTPIFQAAGGTTPLTTVVDLIADTEYSICARVTGGPVYCWGGDATSTPYPVSRKDSSNIAISTIESPLYGSYDVGLSYVDRNADVAAAANDAVTQPSCSGLIPAGQ
jgi:alpha-tubulin suppressor-like RCC1 family protein/uncharacterized membrane protein YgcG